jgi:membrane-bound lytic murein transglycosylase F
LFFSCNLEKNENSALKLEEETINILPSLPIRDFDDIIASGALRVVIQNSPTSYFIHKGEPMGYEYDLSSRLADYFDLELKILAVDDIQTALNYIENGYADILAYNLTITKERKDQIAFSEPIYLIKQVLVQKKPNNWRKQARHKTEKQLLRNVVNLENKEVYVVRNSSHKRRLENLSDEIGANITIVEADENVVVEQLLAQVNEGVLPYAVADDNVANMFAGFYPDLDVKTEVSLDQNIAFGVSKDAVKWLDTLNFGIRNFKREPDLNILFKRYFGKNKMMRSQVKNFSNQEHINSISNYDSYLKHYSLSLEWDWRLLAALIYTESKFDARLTSWSGAEGLMQIMPKTFEVYNLKNPFDPEQNIEAGTKHLLWLEKFWDKRLEDNIDSSPFILASYNAGQAHVLDAIALCKYRKMDASKWSDVSQNLRLLSQPKYYTLPVVKYGYCRGNEPADYVLRIQNIYTIYKDLIPE